MGKLEAKEAANYLLEILSKHYGDRASNFKTELYLSIAGQEFSISFIVYDYAIITVNSDRGCLWVGINHAGVAGCVPIHDLDVWMDEFNKTEWISKFDEEIKLRIPDRYLQAKGI